MKLHNIWPKRNFHFPYDVIQVSWLNITYRYIQYIVFCITLIYWCSFTHATKETSGTTNKKILTKPHLRDLCLSCLSLPLLWGRHASSGTFQLQRKCRECWKLPVILVNHIFSIEWDESTQCKKKVIEDKADETGWDDSEEMSPLGKPGTHSVSKFRNNIF